MKEVAVKHGERVLGTLSVVENDDWTRKDREATPLDFELIAITLSARALYEIMEKFPDNPDGESDTPWVLIIIDSICKTQNNENAQFKNSILTKYISINGMDQILRSHSINVDELKTYIDKVKSP